MSSKGKLSKEQLRALRAQRTAALAAQQQAAPPAVAAPPAPPAPPSRTAEEARSMPPPPPRAPSARATSQQQLSAQRPSASYHTDSQGTRLHDSAALQATADLHAEPSINQRGGGGRGATSAEEVRSTQSVGAALPGGFFEQHPAGSIPMSVVNSAAVNSAAPGSAAAGSAPAAEQGPAAALEQAMSIEGSTGAGAAAPAPAGGDVTSAASQHDAGPTGASAVPAGFFENVPAAADSVVGAAADAEAGTAVSSRPQAGGQAADSAAPLPKGFFEDKKADAKARGEVPKTEKDLAKEYADFMKQVDVESAAAAQQQATEEEEAAAGRLDREDFEQFVRMEKLEALKTAHATGAAQRPEEVDAAATAAAQAIADPEAQRPAIHLAKKRRVMDTVAELERGPGSDGSSDEDEPAELLDWRAKKSAF